MTSIYCIGRNYADHAKELGNAIPITPVVFLKTKKSIRYFEESKIAFSNEAFHFEGEIILKIGKDHVLGEKFSPQSIESISFGIDLTRRAEQSLLKKQGLPWTTSKSFLGSSIVGSFYEISNFEDLKNIEFKFSVNNELKQVGNSKNMIFSIEEIITYLNSFSPLEKGDLVYTGTPEGVGEIRVGDEFEFSFNIREKNIVEKGRL